jgi:hypothetical protein
VFTLFTDSGYNVYNAAGLSAPNQWLWVRDICHKCFSSS